MLRLSESVKGVSGQGNPSTHKLLDSARHQGVGFVTRDVGVPASLAALEANWFSERLNTAVDAVSLTWSRLPVPRVPGSCRVELRGRR